MSRKQAKVREATGLTEKIRKGAAGGEGIAEMIFKGKKLWGEGMASNGMKGLK